MNEAPEESTAVSSIKIETEPSDERPSSLEPNCSDAHHHFKKRMVQSQKTDWHQSTDLPPAGDHRRDSSGTSSSTAPVSVEVKPECPAPPSHSVESRRDVEEPRLWNDHHSKSSSMNMSSSALTPEGFNGPPRHSQRNRSPSHHSHPNKSFGNYPNKYPLLPPPPSSNSYPNSGYSAPQPPLPPPSGPASQHYPQQAPYHQQSSHRGGAPHHYAGEPNNNFPGKFSF